MSVSPSSQSGTTSPTSNDVQAAAGADLAIKYHKLANEYAKLRAQFGVVKKAVVDEQGRNAELAESLRLKEVKERKWEAEMDSLNFRNQQLTRRIQVLQDEIEALEHFSGKKKSGRKSGEGHAPPVASSVIAIQSSEMLNSVIGQELQAKIDENARLHARLSDIDQRYEELVGSLQSRIRELESEAKRKAQGGRAEDSKQKDLIQGLKTENVELIRQIQQLEKELVDHQDHITVLTVQLESAHYLSPAKSHLSSLHTLRTSQPKKNFPLTTNDARIQSVELLSQFSESVTDLVASLSDFHTYWEHRLKDIHHDGPLTDNAARLSRLLLQNVKHLKPVEEAFQSVLSNVLSKKEDDASSTVAFFRDFAKSFKNYVEYACEAELLMITCLQYESNLHSCPPTQREGNEQLQTSLHSFNCTLVRLADYLECLKGDDEGKSEEAVVDINVAISQLRQQVCELSSIYSAKATDENQLPTVTDQLKNTNQCIVAALSGMVTCVNGLSRQLSDSLPRIIMLIRVGSQVPPVGEVAVDKPTKLNESAFKEVANTEDFLINSEVDALKEQKLQLELIIKDLKEKIKKIEQNREHWKLDFQLLQMKYDRLRNPEEGGETDQDKIFAESIESLKQPFWQRIDEMVSELLLADSKAVTFHLECVAMKKRLWAAELKKKAMAEELCAWKERMTLLQEVMGTTTANYEGQLGLMTEHVANMNDKLTQQTDQIENLKYELKHKK